MRAEYGALVDRFLAKDPDLEFCALVQTRPNVFLRRTNMSDLRLAAIPNDQATIDKFDVFIFGDIDSSYLRPEQQEMFVKRIRAGAGLVMLGGYHSLGPGGYAGTPLGDALPVEARRPRRRAVHRAVSAGADARGRAASDLRQHRRLLSHAARRPRKRRDCRRWTAARGSTRPGPAPPCWPRCRPAAGEMPVLAVQPLDRGRTAVFAADTTRKWQQGPAGRSARIRPSCDSGGRWSAGWPAAPRTVEAQAGIDASADKAVYEPGETIHLAAVVRNATAKGPTGAKVEADRQRAASASADHVTLSPRFRAQAAITPASFEPRRAGRYEVGVEARLGELTFTSEKLSVEVGRPNLEFERLDLDEKMLAAIAARHRRPLRPALRRRSSHRATRPRPAEEDRARREPALLAAGLLDVVRGDRHGGMDTAKEISTPLRTRPAHR